MKPTANELLLFCAALAPAPLVFSHEGHGLSAPHGHLSELAILAALGVLIALCFWRSRK
jgi:hypothetical protein